MDEAHIDMDFASAEALVAEAINTNMHSAPTNGLQRMIDTLFEESKQVSQMDVLLLAESYDLSDELQEVIELLPPGNYTRLRMCDQLNSIITAHGWGMTLGTLQ